MKTYQVTYVVTDGRVETEEVEATNILDAVFEIYFKIDKENKDLRAEVQAVIRTK